MKMFRIRLFGVDGCAICKEMKEGLKDLALIYIDADADDTQELCDQYNVDILPHVQILDENDSVLWQYASQDIDSAMVVSYLTFLAKSK